ncbi:hypothetical protein LCGC14_2481160, partial [marine sediment metagenome]
MTGEKGRSGGRSVLWYLMGL